VGGCPAEKITRIPKGKLSQNKGPCAVQRGTERTNSNKDQKAHQTRMDNMRKKVGFEGDRHEIVSDKKGRSNGRRAVGESVNGEHGKAWPITIKECTAKNMVGASFPSTCPVVSLSGTIHRCAE